MVRDRVRDVGIAGFRLSLFLLLQREIEGVVVALNNQQSIDLLVGPDVVVVLNVSGLIDAKQVFSFGD